MYITKLLTQNYYFIFTKSNLLATLVSFFTLYLLGWAFYCVIADKFYMQHTILQGVHKEDSIDGIWCVFYYGITGAIISLVYKQTSKESIYG